jgi:replicative DNA helicase
MDAERALVTAIAQSGKHYEHLAADGVNETHFASEDCADVWSFIQKHTERYGKQPNVPLIMEQFPDFNFEITDQPIDYLKDRFVQEIERRLADEFNYELAAAVADPQYNGQLADMILEKGRELTNLLPGQSVSRLSDANLRIKDYEERAKDGHKFTGLRMGIPAIDEATLGIQRHELVTVVGWQGMGKSTLVQRVLLEFYKQQQKCLFISLEMTAEALFRKWDQMINQFTSYKHLKTLNLNDAEVARWKEWAKEAKEEAPNRDILVLEDVQSCTVEKIHGEILRHKPDVVAIDYITLMETPGLGSAARWEKMTKLSRELKLVAMATETPIFAVAQTNRESAKDGAKLDNIGGAYSIGADSDICIGLHQDNEMRSNKQMEVRLIKNRDGEMVNESMLWDMEKMCFEEFTGQQIFKTKQGYKPGLASKKKEKEKEATG